MAGDIRRVPADHSQHQTHSEDRQEDHRGFLSIQDIFQRRYACRASSVALPSLILQQLLPPSCYPKQPTYLFNEAQSVNSPEKRSNQAT